MLRLFITALFFLISVYSFSQNKSFELFLSDTSLTHASVSFCIAEAESGNIVMEFNQNKSLIPASVMKLITSAAAIELLSPGYTFKTTLGYSGTLNKITGKLTGDIIIKGGGDPALGSKYFPDNYYDFLTKWVSELKKLGVKKIKGKVLTDDSYYDYFPVPSKWLREDEGNYYGAGVYGLSVFDNTYEIHFKTSAERTIPVITGFYPTECKSELTNFLTSEGNSDNGYVFSAPYSNNGWLKGSIPANREDFILKASITDPPLLLARILTDKLNAAGITVSEEPSAQRIDHKSYEGEIVTVAEITSPPLSEILKVLNHESINLYAETILKELGKKFRNNGTSDAGISVVIEFLNYAGIKTDGFFMEDGCGLSPLDAISTGELVTLLTYMKLRGKYFPDFYASLPAAAKEGTLKNIFTDPVFDGNLKAKSGSMTRVRNYAGYFTTQSGKQMVFGIIINNYTGPSKNIITGIEKVLKEIIISK